MLSIEAKRFEAREATLKQVEAFSNLGSWEINLLTNESTWSDQSYKIYGLDKKNTRPTLELFYEHLIEDDVARAKDALQQIMTSGEVDSFECCIETRSGEIKHLVLNAKVIFDDDNNPIKIIGSTQDISEYVLLKNKQRELIEKLEHQATHDALTNLPNRVLFYDRLSQLIKTSQRDSRQFALLFIDLDQFKTINDSLGHDIGDEVLKEIAYRLRKSIRGADTLARLGGDEFTIILRNLQDSAVIPKICEKISFEIKKPIVIKEHTLYVSASIGISEFPKDSSIDAELIKYADVAMYQAKSDGRNNHKFFNAKLNEMANEKVILENALRIAIQEEQFVVYYQPQYNLDSNTMTGMEALVRWEHPSLGLVAPSKFIPLAEENGMIVDLDRIVMKMAMKQFRLWHNDTLNPGTLALNLAMKQLNEDDFIQTLTQIMYEEEFESKWLELEVTESQVMANPENSIKKLNGLSSLGISIAIDDFGTGYSSLAYLKKLPLDKLKIDRSFIIDVATNEDDGAITKAIIALAKSLSLSIIAEGVEEKLQKDFLQANGCNNFQGYFFEKPLPNEKITTLLKDIKDNNAS